MKLDMHCHTKEGSPDSHVTIEEYILKLKECGFDGMLVTDHDSYDGYNHYVKCLKNNPDFQKKADNFVVVKGIEYDTLGGGHILIVLPDSVELSIFERKGLPLHTVIKIVHAYGGIVGPAHPCGEPFLSLFSTGKYRKDRSIASEFDFIEGFNSGEDDEANKEAMAIAAKYDKPMTAGSDAHWTDCVGLAYTIIDEEIHCADDLIKYVKACGHTSIGGQKFLGTLKERLGKWNKLLVYGFFPYNKFGAVVNGPKRSLELANIMWDINHVRDDEKKRLGSKKEIEDLTLNIRIHEHISDLIENDKIAQMHNYRQHGQISTLEHCKRVVLASDKLSRGLKLRNIDTRAMLRGALLHDFYLYDWHHDDNGEHKWHGYHHADKARENAVEHFKILKKEQEIIHTHMWPLNISRVPKSKEAWVVCLADKYVSFTETMFKRK